MSANIISPPRVMISHCSAQLLVGLGIKNDTYSVVEANWTTALCLIDRRVSDFAAQALHARARMVSERIACPCQDDE